VPARLDEPGAFVLDPFTPQARLDTERLARLVPDAVRMMDNIVDISRFPLQEQQHEAKAKRASASGHRACRRADHVRSALRRAGCGGRDRGVVRHDPARRYLASATLAAEKARFRCSRPTNTLRAKPSPRSIPTSATPSPSTACAIRT